jgi:copper chaperone NosL
MRLHERALHEILRGARASLLSLVALAAAACAPEPEPIAYGEDLCAHCRMVIVDERYGAELVTTKGRIFKFDSIECLADYVLRSIDAADVHSLWVTDYRAPGTLIDVTDATFLHSPALNSPMGANLTAFTASGITPDDLLEEFGGEVLDWAGVLDRVSARPPAGGHMHGSPDS